MFVRVGQTLLMKNSVLDQIASDYDTTEVEIRPGETSRAELEVSSKGQRLEVLVKLKGGGEVTSSQVLLMEGDFKIERGGEAASAKLLAESRFRSVFTNRSKPAVFTGVAPGRYSVCVVPLAGDIADPDFGKAVMDNIEQVKIHCEPTEVAADPKAVVVEVDSAYRPPSE